MSAMTSDTASPNQPASQGGGDLTLEKILVNLQGDDLGLRVYAAWWLGRFRANVPDAVDALIRALADEDDRTQAGGYPLRRNAARALGKLGNRQAVPGLIQSLSCSDFYVREAATQSLEMLGDLSCIPTLVALLKDQVPGTEPAPEPPQLAQPYDAILEALGSLQARDVTPLIEPFLEHEVPRVRFSAARALYQLATHPDQARPYGDRLVQELQNRDLQLRRSVLADLGAIGYFHAAEAIAQTQAENSLKLISLQGLLEHQLQQQEPPGLTPEAIHLMTLMDGLL